MERPAPLSHHQRCALGVPKLELGDVTCDVLQEIADKLDRTTVGMQGVDKLATALGFKTGTIWKLDDYLVLNPHKSKTMMFFRLCASEGITLDLIQAGLETINSVAADVIPQKLRFIPDVQRPTYQMRDLLNKPQENTESFSTNSFPGHHPTPTYGRRQFTSPLSAPQNPHQHVRRGIKREPGNDCDQWLYGATNQVVETPRLSHHTNPKSASVMSDYNSIRTDTCYGQTSVPWSHCTQSSVVEPRECHCSNESYSLPQGSPDNTSAKVPAQSHPHPLLTVPDSHFQQVGATDIGSSTALVHGSFGSSQNTADFNCDMQNHLESATNNHDDALVRAPAPSSCTNFEYVNRVQRQPYPHAASHSPHTQSAFNIQHGRYEPESPIPSVNHTDTWGIPEARKPLCISNISSSDDSVTDSSESYQNQAFIRSSIKRHKVDKAASRKRVFVTGGSCPDEMGKIRQELEWIEKLGVTVDWDDGRLKVGEMGWTQKFQSATLVLIGVTRNYVTNVANRGWLPRAADINKAVQEERLERGGDNKRFLTIVFTETNVRKADLKDLKVAPYCWPRERERLEDHLKQKL